MGKGVEIRLEHASKVGNVRRSIIGHHQSMNVPNVTFGSAQT